MVARLQIHVPFWLHGLSSRNLELFGPSSLITSIFPKKTGVPILNASYSASNITELFFLEALSNLTGADVNYTEVGVRYEAVSHNSPSGMRLLPEAPDVEIYCFYSIGVYTAKT